MLAFSHIYPYCPLIQQTNANGALLIGMAVSFVSLYCHVVIKQAPFGIMRLLLLLPCLAVHFTIPLLFSCDHGIILRGTSAFLFSIVANLKLVGLALNRGPLSSNWSLLQSFVVLYQPIYPKPRTGRKPASPQVTPVVLLLNWGVKAALVLPTMFILSRPPVSPLYHLIQEAGCVFMIFCMLGLYMDGPAAIIGIFFEIPLMPPFDYPWLSISLRDFWGARWNLTVSHLLRDLFYDPVIEGRLIRPLRHMDTSKVKGKNGKLKRISEGRRFLALLSTFIASGLMHEAIFWAMQTDGLVTWKWLAFFLLQPILMFVERQCLTPLLFLTKRPWLQRIVTIGILFTTAHFLFFPPMNIDSDSVLRLTKAFGV